MSAECHELTTRTDGRTELAYAGERPWHGLGQKINDGATIEEMRVAAGMDWEIERSVVQFQALIPPTEFPGEPTVETFVDSRKVVLHRSDTHAPLGVVSKSYRAVQPATALEFFRDMTDVGGYTLESAGTMRGGARFFATAKVGEGFELPGGDRVANRILFATSCDHSLATCVVPTTIRVICRNTLRAALGEDFGKIVVRHNTEFDPAVAKARLAKIDKTFAAFAETAGYLARRQITTKLAERFISDLLPDPIGGAVQDTKGYKTILALFDGAGIGADLASARGTMWGLLNAVTQYVDHGSRARSDEARTESALFGAGDALKSRALAMMAAA